MAPGMTASATATTSARSSVGPTKPKSKVNSNGYHPTATIPLSAMSSTALDLTSVERRGQPTAPREPIRKASRPHGISDAPTYYPTAEDWRDPSEYMKKIAPEASQYGICKIIPPDSWNPDFAIDTEKFHFRTRKQELNSVEGSTRANLTYLDGLGKFHKQQGNNLHRLPYVDKKPLDLYRLKKAVESRGGFDNVCKLKKWAEIGRDLGYSGKIMSSLSTSLKNSYQRWLCPYEEYLRLAKPGVHQQLEQEYGGPLTPSPAQTPIKRSEVNTPSGTTAKSPARNASEALQNGLKREADRDTPMLDAPPAPTSGGSGFTAVNSGFTSINRASIDRKSFTPEVVSTRNVTPDDHTGLGSAAQVKQGTSTDVVSDASKKEADGDNEDGANRRSKRLKRENVPTVAGSHMTPFRPSVPRIPREEDLPAGETCETCGQGEAAGSLLVCESCDNSYHGLCLDPPVKRKPDAEWNCPRCLVGDGQFGFEEGGLYSLKQFQQKANDFKQGYFEKKMPFDSTLKCHRPVTEEDVENEFWRLVADLEETVEVEYGADIHCTTHGSGFPTLEKNPGNPYAASGWNLNVLPFASESLFRHIKSDISGMTVPWVYVGMMFSTFCWHNEDHYAYSANYQHFGATKTWYGIPGADAEKFEAAMRDAVPELFETQPDLLFQLVTLLTPEQLTKAGVRVYAIDQRAGQMVITFPQAYHAGFNHGFNFNEAVNFAPPDWESYGMAGVERLQAFRRQPCFSHDELLWTAAEGASASLTISTAKWLGPALERIQKRELADRELFVKRHLSSATHKCQCFNEGDGNCPLSLKIEDEDILDEDEQCCSYCKAFAYLSRYKCHQSGKVLCILHAGNHACCNESEENRYLGAGHTLYYRKTEEMMRDAHTKVIEKADTPRQWEEKYAKLLDEEMTPSLKSLRGLLHEGERIPFDLPSLPILKEFVDRCNEWVDEATTYIVRKQQNRRKNERAWQTGTRRSIGNSSQDQKEPESRNVSNIYRLLQDAEHIGFDCPEISQLLERSASIEKFQTSVSEALKKDASPDVKLLEELLEEGRSFNVDTPEIEALSRTLRQKRWNEKAEASRKLPLTLSDVQDLIEEGKRLGLEIYNDHFKFYCNQMAAGESWEAKARELIHAEFVHYPQLEALSKQVQVGALPVSKDTLAAVDQILHKQREAHRQILDITERCREDDFRKRPMYSEVVDVTKQLEDLNSKPNGTLDLENERKRHEDWMRKGKRLFGKSNAPLHILKNHLEYVLERNLDCFDTEHDTPRLPAEPVSREQSPDGIKNTEDTRRRQVFCMCRKVEAGMMIECELCHEWYHYKCLKIARGKVKEDDKYTCPICDWRMKIPRDAARPKLEDLIALIEEVPHLPFQPEEEEVLQSIISNAQNFREYVSRYCNSLVSTEAEAETQRFYLRKLEGAEVLLAYETNFFRQELHKWYPVAPDAPPILEVSLSTRKPRPTKLQKMLVEYGVDNPDDLPEHAKGKANSLRRKAANAEAAAAAAQSGPGSLQPPSSNVSYGGPAYYSQDGQGDSDRRDHSEDDGNDDSVADHPREKSTSEGREKSDDGRSLGEAIEDVNIHTEAGKAKALEILGRTEDGKRQAEKIWGSDVWTKRALRDADVITPKRVDESKDEAKTEKMLTDTSDEKRAEERSKEKKDVNDAKMTTESLEDERNGLDAMIDGE
ncbi:PHD transcription factor (Rum1) [Cordyceps militaris]|uniref:PHD transcription factor (Rum1) n=1 Tax=Cordyceps militaris TaxID=73501 RepID=A0A2H4SI63_CORMI|nr:PHD transcription factor (Rum1) [Cordyceps militaris]